MSTPFHLPQRLREASGSHHAELRAWTETLPAVVADLTQRWNLQLGDPFEPGGMCSWVAPALDAAGTALALKVEWRHTEAAHEADALRLWSGDGAVMLYDRIQFDETIALLLERCVPGTPLGLMLPEVEQDVIVAGLLRRLWRTPPDGHPFRPLATMCREWVDEFEIKLASNPAATDAGLAREGASLFRDLPTTAATNVLLCTDLHGENILAATREPWLAIDPKPYVGDPAYDALQHMLQCRERLESDPAGFVLRIATLLEIDADRLKLWLFARCVIESVGNPWLAEVAARIAP